MYKAMHDMCTLVHAQTLQHARQSKTLDYSPLKPSMLASSVLAVVACNATVPRVCTLVLYIVHLCVCLQLNV